MFPYRKLLNLLDNHVMHNPIDTTATTADTTLAQLAVGNLTNTQFLMYKERFFDWLITTAGNVLGAILIFIIGRFVIRFILRMLRGFMTKRNVEASLSSFIVSMVNVLLIVLLVVSVINKLGVETTSFAALMASIGLAVGMAFSGNLQNFASGVIILLMRPYKVGDLITTNFDSSITATVYEIQIFHTILRTFDGNTIYVPNNLMMNNAVTNSTKLEQRLIMLAVGVDYGVDFAKVERTLLSIASGYSAVLKDPAPYVILKDLADSSVIAELRCMVPADQYAATLHALRRTVYERFNAEGIDFPFPQITVHQA